MPAWAKRGLGDGVAPGPDSAQHPQQGEGEAPPPGLPPPGSVPVIPLASARRDAIRGEVVSAPTPSERSAQSTKPCRAVPSRAQARQRPGPACLGGVGLTGLS